MAEETQAKTTRKKPNTGKPDETQIKDAYLKHLLSTGSEPVSMYKFASDLKISEGELYQSFRSFNDIEGSIWSDFMRKTLQILYADINYSGFSAREKLLSFYYTHLDVLKENRSFVTMKVRSIKNPAVTPDYLKQYKSSFNKLVNEIINDGYSKGEIKQRPLISQQYDKGFWVQLAFVINFWVNDSSQNFERTDAAIEKAVNLSFDLIGHTSFDSMIDFAKFLIQGRR